MRWTAVLLAALLGVGSCQRADSGAQADAASEMTAPTPAVVRFVARDFAFEGPDTLTAGWTEIVLHNEGPELHHLMLLRLTEGRTVGDLEAAIEAMQPGEMLPPEWAVPFGGPNPPDVGAETRAIIRIEPGNYAVVCLVDTPDHIPHMMKGMVTGLTVVPAGGATAPEPTGDITVNLVDFAFGPGSALTAGRHLLKVVNAGTQPHELEIVRLGEGKTLDDLAQWGATFEGDLPGSSLGGASPMAPGQVAYIPVDFTPGNYVLLCFVPDPLRDNIPHLAEGMLLPFTIS